MQNLNHDTIELALIAVIGLAMVFQAVVLLALFLSLKKTAHRITEEVGELRATLMPVLMDTRDVLSTARDIIDRSRGVLTRSWPKVEQSVNDLSSVAAILKEQTVSIEVTVRDLLDRAHNQTLRVDAMVSEALNSVDRASNFVVHTVNKPLRQINGLLASVKAIVDSLRRNETVTSDALYSSDQDNFV